MFPFCMNKSTKIRELFSEHTDKRAPHPITTESFKYACFEDSAGTRVVFIAPRNQDEIGVINIENNENGSAKS